MSDATNPAVAPDAQQYDWREDVARCYPSSGARLAAYIERLEAERDALLAEHEAVRPGIEWGELTPSGAMFFPPTTTLRG